MTALLGILPLWLWRWVGIAAVASSAGLAFYWKGIEHEAALFDAYKAQVKVAGDKQNELTRQTIQAHKQLQELSDAEARTSAATRDAALARLRSVQRSAASQRLVPAAAPDSAGGGRVCYAREELDRGIRSAVARAAERLGAIAEEGQRSADVAALCRNWAKKL